MPTVRACASMLLAVGFVAAAARAGVTAVSRDSFIRAALVLDENATNVVESTAGTKTFDPFDRSVSQVDDARGTGQASASQTSSLSFKGGNLAGAMIRQDATGVGTGEASARFDLVFDVTSAPAHFTLIGSAGGGGPSGGLGSVQLQNLTSGEVLVFHEENDEPGHGSPLETAGSLPPARYDLLVLAGGGGDGGGGADLAFTVSAVPLPPALLTASPTLLLALAAAAAWPRGGRPG